MQGVKRALPTILACAAATLVACGEKPEPPVATAASTTNLATTAKFPLAYQKIGGIAGINERLWVSRRGAATLRLGYAPDASTSRFELAAGERRRLGRLLSAANLKPGHGPPTGCADCFEYAIATPAGKTRFDESQIPKPARPLVAYVDGLIEDNIPARAAVSNRAAGNSKSG